MKAIYNLQSLNFLFLIINNTNSNIYIPNNVKKDLHSLFNASS